MPRKPTGSQWQYKPVPTAEPDAHSAADCLILATPEGWSLLGARVRGKKHKHEGTNCDDWMEADTAGGWTLGFHQLWAFSFLIFPSLAFRLLLAAGLLATTLVSLSSIAPKSSALSPYLRALSPRPSALAQSPRPSAISPTRLSNDPT